MAGSSFYDNYVPTLNNILESLEAILTRAETHAKENNIDVNAEYAPARLHADMLPLTFQVQAVTNLAKSFVEKVAGVKVEVWEDDETTFEQLFARINKARELTKGVKPEDVNGKEHQTIEGKAGASVYRTTCLTCVTTFILPNLFFHLQTAYAILRMKGVPLSKLDYLFAFLSKDTNSPYGQA
ncbi:putative helix-turn-helix-domain containing protein type [Diaporthe ampelina]|uniref:Putative helix-turn-helix-domain containing protein type n=1 Tax=Diaporthe ampelina TaxID=1214573 RepID=A0A0G2F7V0_9PEZI|nr:putative helix-turn-helix-domain containing protein type [Diaporthe ampelina]